MALSSSNGHQPGGERSRVAAWWARAKLRGRLAKLHESAGNIPGAFRLVWESSPPATVVMAALTLAGALIPAAQAWTGKLIVDSVVAALNGHVGAEAGLRQTLPYLGIEFGLLLASTAIAQGRSLTEHMLHARMNYHINTLIIRKAMTLDLVYFEDADFYDKLQNARREADWRALQIVNGGFYLVQNLISMLTYFALLLRFSPWLAALLFAATIPAFIAQSRYAQLSFRLLSWRAPEARQMNYLEYLLTVDNSAKEVKLFGLGEPLLERYRRLFWKFLLEDEDIARRRSLASFVWGLLATLSYYVSYAWIIFRTAGGGITLGDMTLYLSLFRQSKSTFESIFEGLGELYENTLFMTNLFTYLALQPQMSSGGPYRPLPPVIRQGIEFRGVSFRYPGSESWALHDVNLVLRPGEKLALVGPNGAGKTTLIKLLTRLYEPTEGQILLDGVDVREYDIDALRRRIGVIFQDFVRYFVSARENVGFGQIEWADDMVRVRQAAEWSGAHPVLQKLPSGYDTTLGRWFERGHDLSGGEWQKVALSRAYIRDSEVLVLDEPTAALDAENEVRVFQRFRELTAGKMAVLISHRFSTVRIADRIAVIEEGQITELGSHYELLALGGTYARLFNLQAEGYR